MDVVLDVPPGFRDTEVACWPNSLTDLVHLSSGCRRPHEPTQCDHGTGACQASVFEQPDPTMMRPPWTPKCTQVPHNVNGDYAHSPDDDQQCRGRRQKWQQPEKVPWEYGGGAQKRCCHRAGKIVRGPPPRCPS